MPRTLRVFTLAALAPIAFAHTAFADEPAAQAVAPLAPAPKADSKTVTVDLQANDGRATVERRLGTTSLVGWPFTDASFASVGHWEQACVAPCEVKLDPHFTYRVSGDGLTPSESFALPRGKDQVKLWADMGSSKGRLAGIVLASMLNASAAAVTLVLRSLATRNFPSFPKVFFGRWVAAR